MKTTVFAFVAALSLLPLSAYASTIFTDGFQTGTPSLAVTTAGNFITTGGTNVDLLGGGLYGGLCTPATIQCVDLDGSDGQPQGILQSNTTFAAGSYLLSFLLTGSGRGNQTSTRVTFGDFNTTFTLNSSGTDTILNQLVTVTTPGALVFTSNTPGNVGSILDAVSISTAGTVASTPEPSSLTLLGSATLAGFRLVLRRRKS